MKNSEFQELIKNDLHQVFLFACPAGMPFSFAVHPWFVLNKRGAISRWEVFWRIKEEWKMRWGHLHKDFYQPALGTQVFFFSQKPVWKEVTILGCIEGGEGSPAHKMLECIEHSPLNYPYGTPYRLRGPNSNTYVQWALDQFPDSGLRLPWNAFGKDYGK